MSLTNIVSGDYGQVIRLTVLDTDTDAAADISGYSTSVRMVFKDPDGEEVSKVAEFYTDGSDGVVQYTLADGDIGQAGIWKVRVYVTRGTALLTSTWLPFVVLS